jgi:hypothetical protein
MEVLVKSIRVTDYMEKCPCWEADTFLAGYEILRLLWNYKSINLLTKTLNWTVSWRSWVYFVHHHHTLFI